MKIKKIFATSLYQAQPFKGSQKKTALHNDLLREVEDLLSQDHAGHKWSDKNYPHGYTSYASVNDLHKRSARFGALEKAIDAHVKSFCKILKMELAGSPLQMSTCWANVMPPNTFHTMHLHPLSVISGTYYLQIPKGSSAIRFEDPRLDRFMGSPPRKDSILMPVQPTEGDLLLFESWLRHEVPLNKTNLPRISISFNYEWK